MIALIAIAIAIGAMTSVMALGWLVTRNVQKKYPHHKISEDIKKGG